MSVYAIIFENTPYNDRKLNSKVFYGKIRKESYYFGMKLVRTKILFSNLNVEADIFCQAYYDNH